VILNTFPQALLRKLERPSYPQKSFPHSTGAVDTASRCGQCVLGWSIVDAPLGTGSVSFHFAEVEGNNALVREHPWLPCVKGAGSRVPRKRETEGLSK